VGPWAHGPAHTVGALLCGAAGFWDQGMTPLTLEHAAIETITRAPPILSLGALQARASIASRTSSHPYVITSGSSSIIPMSPIVVRDCANPCPCGRACLAVPCGYEGVTHLTDPTPECPVAGAPLPHRAEHDLPLVPARDSYIRIHPSRRVMQEWRAPPCDESAPRWEAGPCQLQGTRARE
jgi:hypothetical protein